MGCLGEIIELESPIVITRGDWMILYAKCFMYSIALISAVSFALAISQPAK